MTRRFVPAIAAIRTGLVLVLVAAGIGAARAEQPASIEPANLRGFGGVVTQCVTRTDAPSAPVMCDILVKEAEAKARAAGIAIAHLGTVDWSREAGELLQPGAETGIENPVWLTFTLRGTKGKQVSANAWASLHVPVSAAIPAREGEAVQSTGMLVFWEEATLGDGPPVPLARAVAQAVAAKLDAVFGALAAASAL